MTDPPTKARAGDVERQLREMNEALLVSSVHQHELTEKAQRAEEALRESEERFHTLADNIVAVLAGEQPEEYRHAYAGSVASLGLHKGVAQVYGVKLKGWPAWFMHRSYHVSRVPTFNRKARVVADWTLAFVLRRETIALGQLHQPREEFTHVTPPVRAPEEREPISAGSR